MADAEDLYLRFGPGLYKYALALLANRAAAEDVIQQVFLAILKWPDLQMRSEVDYLRQAVRNECYSVARRIAAAPKESPLLEDIGDGGVDHVERIALEKCLRELPIEQREAVHFHVFEGLTFQQIGERIGASPNTVSARYRYALGKMRQSLIAPRAGESALNGK